MKNRVMFASALVISIVAFGCVEDSTSPMSLSGDNAGGSAGAGGSGGCTDGIVVDCECEPGVKGTKECDDGEFGDCVCKTWPDDDNDGHGDENADPVEGTDVPDGNVGNHDDCDDDDPDVYTGAEEVCDGKDNDCDGHIDEGCTEDEVCDNNVDDDNDGLVDCNDPDCDNDAHCGGEEYTHYHDGDGDGYTDGASKTDKNPEAPNGYTNDPEDGIDCQDDDDTVYPGAPELCDGKDNDCDGDKDEGCLTDEVCDNNVDDDNDGLVDCNDPDCDNDAHCGGEEYTHYHDGDGDGYTDGASITDKNPNAPSGYTNSPEQGIDCNDSNPNVNPGHVEVCGNGIDDNCDGNKDEGCVEDEICTNGVDDDNDGLVDCADPDCDNASNCNNDCTNGTTQSCTCGSGETGTQTCVGGDWSACVCGGVVTLKFEVDCSAQSWVQNVVPEGSWAGRDHGPLTGCVSTGARKTACTFEIPAPDYPTFVGQGDIGFGRYSGDGSGNAPAPCVTPSEATAMQGTSITLLCTHRLWKDGVPMEQTWESNGVMKPSGTLSCSESGSFPYYNSVPAE